MKRRVQKLFDCRVLVRVFSTLLAVLLSTILVACGSAGSAGQAGQPVPSHSPWALTTPVPDESFLPFYGTLFSSKAMGVSFAYPESWSLKTRGTPEAADADVFVHQVPPKGAASMDVSVAGAGGSAEESGFAGATRADLRSMLHLLALPPGAHVLRSGLVTRGGLRLAEAEFLNEPVTGAVFHSIVFASRRGPAGEPWSQVIGSIIVPSEDWQTLRPTIQAILRSMRFSDPHLGDAAAE